MSVCVCVCVVNQEGQTFKVNICLQNLSCYEALESLMSFQTQCEKSFPQSPPETFTV